MELGFHSFLDINSSRIRTQDHSVNHVETFMANVIRIFVSFHRATDNFHLPVQELSTYREVIGAWILDIRNNAPSLTASHFNFMATELKLRYVSDPLAFERDRHGFGPFLQDLRMRFIDIERRVTEFNFMCGSIKVEEMAILMSFLEPAQLAELKRRAATTLLKSTNASVTSGVAQAVEVHTIQTNTSQDTVKVKGGVVGKRKSFPASHSDAKAMKKSNPVVTASNPNPFCNSCGKTHANANTAMCRSVINKHPNVNLDRGPDGNLVPWAKSTMGTRLRACGMSYIHNNFQVDKQHVKTEFKQTGDAWSGLEPWSNT
jgi:hypothetical protein